MAGSTDRSNIWHSLDYNSTRWVQYLNFLEQQRCNQWVCLHVHVYFTWKRHILRIYMQINKNKPITQENQLCMTLCIFYCTVNSFKISHFSPVSPCNFVKFEFPKMILKKTNKKKQQLWFWKILKWFRLFNCLQRWGSNKLHCILTVAWQKITAKLSPK